MESISRFNVAVAESARWLSYVSSYVSSSNDRELDSCRCSIIDETRSRSPTRILRKCSVSTHRVYPGGFLAPEGSDDRVGRGPRGGRLAL